MVHGRSVHQHASHDERCQKPKEMFFFKLHGVYVANKKKRINTKRLKKGKAPMLLLLPASAYTPEFVYFSMPVKNNIIEDSSFIRITYSTSHYTMAGVYLRNFSMTQLHFIENDLLTAYNPTKNKTLSLCDHSTHHSMLKISGVWETATNIGLAYKFNHLF